MKLVKVELKISRTKGLAGSITKIVELPQEKTQNDTARMAELNYCNQYIARNCDMLPFTDLSRAKKFANLKITSRIV